MPDAWSRVPPYLARRAKTHRTLHWPVGAPVGTGMNHPFSSAQRAKREKSGCFKASIIAYGPAVPPPSVMSLNYVEITASLASAALARLIFSRISRPEARQTYFFGFRLRWDQIGCDGADQLARGLKASFSNHFGG